MSSETYRDVSLPKGADPETSYGTAMFALSHALKRTIQSAADANGGIGPWFDDLEAAAIREAESHVDVGLDMAKAALAITYGRDVVAAVFDLMREKLSKGPPA